MYHNVKCAIQIAMCHEVVMWSHVMRCAMTWCYVMLSDVMWFNAIDRKALPVGSISSDGVWLSKWPEIVPGNEIHLSLMDWGRGEEKEREVVEMNVRELIILRSSSTNDTISDHRWPHWYRPS